ncbi:hypothetical protein [Streptomyces sp. NPDC005533]|uniref:hypothetical protein n=1 Tax=Streptomyces sp. NPDC005533 TaxID=3364723 RepID=UPI0036798E9B
MTALTAASRYWLFRDFHVPEVLIFPVHDHASLRREREQTPLHAEGTRCRKIPFAREGPDQLNDKLNEVIADLRVIKGDVLAIRIGRGATDQELDTFIGEQRKTNETLVSLLSERGRSMERRAAAQVWSDSAKRTLHAPSLSLSASPG